ncbi:GNAT family N-acetyltransferase [Lentilactobacillus sp. Marseille-Q4993]|uniref:GNAT family N-acetyltransferase n=1 Tax=Lentilactobacillus sp. Marseille-Q4993 TaxID=3039492 RepID=UPI0024BCFF99|nr:GNAT family N-acetyltransferase [Lentilactobacillus sp. Marseille-Q4993]
MKKIGIIVGSLRRYSWAKALAKNIAIIFPAEFQIEFIDISRLGLFNEDIESQPNAEWDRFRDQVRSSDGIVFVTPEYNRSIPGGLKNALDVGSRPTSKSVWEGKPAMIVSTSTGRLGGYNASQHLKDIALGMYMKIDGGTSDLNIGGVASIFDNNLALKDKGIAQLLNMSVRKFISQVVVSSIEPAISQAVGNDSDKFNFAFLPHQLHLSDLKGNQVAFADIELKFEPDVIIVDHIEVDDKYRGQGIAKLMAEKIVTICRTFDLKVDPQCEFAVDFFERNQQYHDLVQR